MHAVFELSGFQFTASEGDVVRVPLQDTEAGQTIDIGAILVLKTDDGSLVGTPHVADAKIEAEVLRHGKDDKVEIYKYKRRTKYRRRQGHRQDFSEIKINRIVAPQS
ncbi:MAG: 50S ribosomal protein L21 [Candidatus Zixiibacteriota bacterium]